AIAAVAFLPQVSADAFLAGGPPMDYHVDYLLSDGTVPAEQVDLGFKNGWGLADSQTGPWWVSVNEESDSAIVGAERAVAPLNVSMPGSPTGIVHSTGDGFEISDGETSAPARFLFALENGMIAGWNPALGSSPPNQQAFVAVDRSAEGSVYKGLAIAD